VVQGRHQTSLRDLWLCLLEIPRTGVLGYVHLVPTGRPIATFARYLFRACATEKQCPRLKPQAYRPGLCSSRPYGTLPESAGTPLLGESIPPDTVQSRRDAVRIAQDASPG